MTHPDFTLLGGDPVRRTIDLDAGSATRFAPALPLTRQALTFCGQAGGTVTLQQPGSQRRASCHPRHDLRAPLLMAGERAGASP